MTNADELKRLMGEASEQPWFYPDDGGHLIKSRVLCEAGQGVGRQTGGDSEAVYKPGGGWCALCADG